MLHTLLVALFVAAEKAAPGDEDARAFLDVSKSLVDLGREHTLCEMLPAGLEAKAELVQDRKGGNFSDAADFVEDYAEDVLGWDDDTAMPLVDLWGLSMLNQGVIEATFTQFQDGHSLQREWAESVMGEVMLELMELAAELPTEEADPEAPAPTKFVPQLVD